MALFRKKKSDTLEVKASNKTKRPKAPRLSGKAPRLSRKEKQAAKLAAVEASKVSAATSPIADAGQQASYSHTAYNEPRMGDLTLGDYGNGMPKIRLGEFVNSFARQLRWVLPVFLLGTVAAWYLTKDFKRTYAGEGRILVQLGDEYVYDSVTSKQAQGLQLTPDHIVQNEVGIMKNADIIEQVVGEMISPGSQFTPAQFSKEGFEKINSASSKIERQNAWVDLYTEVEASFVVMPKPKSSIVDLAFKHENPEIAVATLNTFIDKYLEARKALFVEGSFDKISERRRATVEQLNENERKISSFLRKNGISDFDSERTGVTKRTEELRTQLNTLRGEMTETERALATVEQQLRNTPEQIDLFVDDRASQRIAQADLELKQLLAKYLPGSQPVLQKEAELNQLRSLLNSGSGRTAGGRRIGPNPVFQTTLTTRNTLQSRADSLREKEFVLQRQLDAADGKVRRLQDISPVYAGLLRDRETLDERLKNYTAKEQEALVNQEQAESASENVQVIAWATRPRKGSNMRLIMFVLVAAGWGFTLFILAMMKVFLDPKLYASSSQPSSGVTNSNGRRGSDARGYDANVPQYQPAAQTVPQAVPQTAAYVPPQIPESVPAPASSFSAMPYVATASAAPAAAYTDNPYQAQPYYSGANAPSASPQTVMQQDGYGSNGYAPAFSGGGYGNAAEDIYANPYLQPTEVPEPPQNDSLTVLGTAPTETS